MANGKQTSPKVARIASKLLNSPKSSSAVKKVSGSALAQTRSGKK